MSERSRTAVQTWMGKQSGHHGWMLGGCVVVGYSVRLSRGRDRCPLQGTASVQERARNRAAKLTEYSARARSMHVARDVCDGGNEQRARRVIEPVRTREVWPGSSPSSLWRCSACKALRDAERGDALPRECRPRRMAPMRDSGEPSARRPPRVTRMWRSESVRRAVLAGVSGASARPRDLRNAV